MGMLTIIIIIIIIIIIDNINKVFMVGRVAQSV